MVNIYTFCDKTLVGRKNFSAKLLCEELYKQNLRINEVCVFSQNFNLDNLNFKNNEIYFLLLSKPNFYLAEFFANLIGDELVENEDAKRQIMAYLTQNSIDIDPNAKKEWCLPKSAKVIVNFWGRVQAYSIKIGNSEVFVLPENKEEIRQILNTKLISYIENNYSNEYKSETFKTFGITENRLTEILEEDIKNKDKVSVIIFGDGLDNNVVIKAKNDNNLFETYRQKIYNKLQKYIYSVVDISLINSLQKMVKNHFISLSVAGDLSASTLVSKLVDITNNIGTCKIFPNSKCVLDYLGLDRCEINEKMAYEVAVKMLDESKSNFVLTTFCIPEREKREIALIAVGNKVKIDIYKHKLVGTKEEIQDSLASLGVFYLLKRLQQNDFMIN